MEVKALVETLAYRLAEVKAKKVSTHLTAQCSIWRPRHWWTGKLTRY